jgi:DNA-binding transcriptional regulator GbsR (MarR family)
MAVGDEIDAVERRIAEVIGVLMEFWGFKAVMGRLWTILYLSPRPLSAAEIGERLAASTGAVSMALADLQQWGVVKKAWRPGERRVYSEPESSIW